MEKKEESPNKFTNTDINYILTNMLYEGLSLLDIAKTKIYSKKRTQTISRIEYEKEWDDKFLRYFHEQYPYSNNGIIQSMSPLEFKKRVVVKIISNLIHFHSMKNILEIGSGSGLNLILLAKEFPSVKFTGIEPTKNGVEHTLSFIRDPSLFFNNNLITDSSPLTNVNVICGSILDKEFISNLSVEKYDLIFTSAVLEQLNQDLFGALNNIFSLNSRYFCFYESWREGSENARYLREQIRVDYFRSSKEIINNFKDIEVIDFSIPILQPSWMRYSNLLCKKKLQIPEDFN